MYPMLPVSLDCPFLLAPSVFSNVYFNALKIYLAAYGVYIILEIVPSTVILLTELSCWRKSWSNKVNSILSWSHNYKISTVVITVWFIITRNPYFKWQCIFYFLRGFFSFLYQCRTWLYIWVTWRVSYKKQELLTFL